MFSRKKFAARLKLLMEERALTHAALANEIEVNRSAITHYRSMTRNPNVEHLVALAHYFAVSIDYLIGDSDIRERR